ncbi:MAG: GNVR domain-containing protein [Terracidiphilus sp.]|nr:GNVR domain-containing protein [Terracidiphilus sp.]
MTEQNIPNAETATAVDGTSSLEASSQEYEISLIDVLTQLAYRKGLIAKITGVGILIGLALCFSSQVRYTATTKIIPPQQTQSSASMLMNQLSSGGAGSLAAMAGGGLGLKNPNDIYLGLLNSRPIADAIIQKFDLKSVYRASDMTSARKILAANTVVSLDKNGFISVSVTGKDKEHVAEIANAYPDQLRILTKTFAVTEASQRRLFYEDQLKQAKETLLAAELSLQQVQQKKGLVQFDAQAKAMIDSLAALRAQVAAKQVEVQALRSYSTEQNPDVQLVERQLASLQAEVARLEKNNHSSGFANLGMGDVPAAEMEYLRAEHDVRYQQALFDLLLKQYDAARLDEANNAAVIQVVEPAIAPEHKSPQNRILILLLASILGFCTGCFLVLIVWAQERAQADPKLAGKIENLKLAFARKPKG